MEKKQAQIILGDIYQIDKDINGTFDKDKNKLAIGILEEKMNLVAKYWLDELGTLVAKEKAALDKIQNELIIKYGTSDENGMVTVKVSELNEKGEEVFTSNYISFFNELNIIFSQPKTLDYYPIKLEFLKEISTTSNYKSLYRFFEK